MQTASYLDFHCPLKRLVLQAYFHKQEYGIQMLYSYLYTPDSPYFPNALPDVSCMYGLTASGGSGNSAKTIVNPWDVQVTSYNGKKIYSLTSIGMSLLTRLLMGSSRRMAVDTAMTAHTMLMLADSNIYL